ncbi:MAG: hypothetical protein MZW92_01295 [Comamonadaceae bacterium]|nr:hypothetical protein [Comamonadaceae bacterium]
MSEKHANFIVNPDGSATATDIEALIEHVQDAVQEQYRRRPDARSAHRRRDAGSDARCAMTARRIRQGGGADGRPLGRAGDLAQLRQRGAGGAARAGRRRARLRSGASARSCDLKREGFDRVFIALHGRFGEDGTRAGRAGDCWASPTPAAA